MKIRVVQVGNSKGVRIPKAVLEQCNIADEVDLEVKDGKVILEPISNRPRQGWDEQFAAMAESDEDRPFIDDLLDTDIEEWEG